MTHFPPFSLALSLFLSLCFSLRSLLGGRGKIDIRNTLTFALKLQIKRSITDAMNHT